MTLTTAQLDRAVGVLLATAAGDALGAAYEFGPPRGPELEVAMVGGGSFGWEPGEWTDDTSMAIAIAEVAVTGADLRDEEALDALVRRWHEWMHDAKDVGIQTSNVLRTAHWLGLNARTAREASTALHERTGRTAGNGSLMRTAPLALAYLDDEAALVQAARAVSELTHYDPDAGDACVLWCLAIRHAILTGVLDARIGLQHIDAERRDLWASRLDVARSVTAFGVQEQRLGRRSAAGCVVARSRPRLSRRMIRLTASSASTTCAWPSTPRCEAAGTPTRSPPSRADCSALPMGRQRSPRIGVACCMAGQVCAPATSSTSHPRSPAKGEPDGFDFSYTGYETGLAARHPHDDGVWLGDISALRSLPDGVDAVVSLCRVGDADLPAGAEQIDVRLIDQPGVNENLDFVFLDTVRAVEQLRRDGPDRADPLRAGPKPHAHRRRALRREAARHRHPTGIG